MVTDKYCKKLNRKVLILFRFPIVPTLDLLNCFCFIFRRKFGRKIKGLLIAARRFSTIPVFCIPATRTVVTILYPLVDVNPLSFLFR